MACLPRPARACRRAIRLLVIVCSAALLAAAPPAAASTLAAPGEGTGLDSRTPLRPAAKGDVTGEIRRTNEKSGQNFVYVVQIQVERTSLFAFRVHMPGHRLAGTFSQQCGPAKTVEPDDSIVCAAFGSSGGGGQFALAGNPAKVTGAQVYYTTQASAPFKGPFPLVKKGVFFIAGTVEDAKGTGLAGVKGSSAGAPPRARACA